MADSSPRPLFHAGLPLGLSLFDPSTLFVLLVTVVGFLVPMLLVYPPVAPRPSDFLNETHIRIGHGWEEEEASSTAPTSSSSSSSPPRIHSLWIYPVKSCAGIRIDRSRVLPTGFEFDRLFTFAQRATPFPAPAGVPVGVLAAADNATAAAADDPPPWNMVSQRQFPRLATLQVELWRPDFTKAARARDRMRAADADRAARLASLAETFVVVRYPWRPAGWPGVWAAVAAKLARGWRAVPEEEVVLPVSGGPGGRTGLTGSTGSTEAAASAPAASLPTAPVRIWRDVIHAHDLSAELPPSLRLYLGVSNCLGLFRIDPACLRTIFRCAPPAAVAGYQPVTGFQDAYPVHLVNRASVCALEAVVPPDAGLPHLDERRFRANIVVDGIPAYDEDAWKLVAFKPDPELGPSVVKDARFYVCCRTVRCKMPNVHPVTGDRHRQEPDASLRKHRDIDAGAPKMGCLGMQLTPAFDQPDKPDGMELVLDTGMAVDVLERGEHLYIMI